MARYMETAGKAREVVQEILQMVGDDPLVKAVVAAKLGKLYNLGIRTAPRAVQATVRRNAVEAAMRGAPVKVSMRQLPKTYGTGTFNALEIIPVGVDASPESEADSGDED